MVDFIQVTAEYSQAVLVAILPCISDFSKNLELTIPLPVTPSQVAEFRCDPRRDCVGGKVVLTNGFQFSFMAGHVGYFETPQSVYAVQDPAELHRFYGPVKTTEAEALAIARKAISRMPGIGVKELLAAKPRVFADSRVPRYRIEWRASRDSRLQVDVEVNATTKSIESLALLATNFSQKLPPVGVPAPPDPTWNRKKSAPTAASAHPAVTATFSNALLKVVLPQVDTFCRKLNLPVATPIGPDSVTNASFSRNSADPAVQIELLNGFGFVFEHGYVCSFNAPDCFFAPQSKRQGRKYEDFVAQSVLTTTQMVALARTAIQQLGYSDKELPILARSPRLSGGPNNGTKPDLSRFFFQWDYASPDDLYPPPVIGFEVDASTKTLKSLCLLHTNLWKSPPKLISP